MAALPVCRRSTGQSHPKQLPAKSPPPPLERLQSGHTNARPDGARVMSSGPGRHRLHRHRRSDLGQKWAPQADPRCNPLGCNGFSCNGSDWQNLTDANVRLKPLTAGSTELTPPSATVAGANNSWHRFPVTVSFSGADGGSGVAYTAIGPQLAVDRTGWQRGTAVTIATPTNDSDDGRHIVLYRSVDNDGNVEVLHTDQVKIDTLGPVCAAQNATVKYGKSCRIYFKVHDKLSRQVTNVVTITTKSGRVLKRSSRGYGENLAGWWWIKQTCRLPQGTYYIRVYGKDLADNGHSVVGKARLRVMVTREARTLLEQHNRVGRAPPRSPSLQNGGASACTKRCWDGRTAGLDRPVNAPLAYVQDEAGRCRFIGVE